MKLLQKLSQGFIHLIYPPLCLCCKATLSCDSNLFCISCLQLLELINPDERCPCCFSADFCPERRVCSFCNKFPPLLDGIAAAFDYVGPAACLIRKLKY